jgi:hypothetical protein
MNARIFLIAVSAAVSLAASAASPVTVYPQTFEPGGWKLDSQFVDVIGTPYLLAHGLGNRVEDATAEVDIKAGGEYRVWVYARNWAEGSPGRFALEVGGVRLKHEFGAGSSAWSWEANSAIENLS